MTFGVVAEMTINIIGTGSVEEIFGLDAENRFSKK